MVLVKPGSPVLQCPLFLALVPLSSPCGVSTALGSALPPADNTLGGGGRGMQGPGWVYNGLTGKLGDFRSQLGRKKPEKIQTPALLCLRPDREIRHLVGGGRVRGQLKVKAQ